MKKYKILCLSLFLINTILPNYAIAMHLTQNQNDNKTQNKNNPDSFNMEVEVPKSSDDLTSSNNGVNSSCNWSKLNWSKFLKIAGGTLVVSIVGSVSFAFVNDLTTKTFTTNNVDSQNELNRQEAFSLSSESNQFVSYCRENSNNDTALSNCLGSILPSGANVSSNFNTARSSVVYSLNSSLNLTDIIKNADKVAIFNLTQILESAKFSSIFSAGGNFSMLNMSIDGLSVVLPIDNTNSNITNSSLSLNFMSDSNATINASANALNLAQGSVASVSNRQFDQLSEIAISLNQPEALAAPYDVFILYVTNSVPVQNANNRLALAQEITRQNVTAIVPILLLRTISGIVRQSSDSLVSSFVGIFNQIKKEINNFDDQISDNQILSIAKNLIKNFDINKVKIDMKSRSISANFSFNPANYGSSFNYDFAVNFKMTKGFVNINDIVISATSVFSTTRPTNTTTSGTTGVATTTLTTTAMPTGTAGLTALCNSTILCASIYTCFNNSCLVPIGNPGCTVAGHCASPSALCINNICQNNTATSNPPTTTTNQLSSTTNQPTSTTENCIPQGQACSNVTLCCSNAPVCDGSNNCAQSCNVPGQPCALGTDCCSGNCDLSLQCL